MAIDDQASDLVGLVRNDRLVEELLERHIGQRDPRGNHLLGAFGSNTGKAITGARGTCLGKEIAEIVKNVGGITDDVPIGHICSGRSAPPIKVPRA